MSQRTIAECFVLLDGLEKHLPDQDAFDLFEEIAAEQATT
jgi:hypothetical protein